MEQHSEILPRLAAFHDGQLNAQERLTIQAHLEVCPACRLRLVEWQALDLALIRLPVPEPSALEIHRQALAGIESSGSASRRVTLPVRRVRLWTAAAAALLLFAAVSSWLWQQEKSRTIALSQGARSEGTAGDLVIAPQDSAGTTGSTSAPGEPALPSAPIAAQSEPEAVPESSKLERQPYETILSAAPELVGTGDSGIPQTSDWPARLLTLERAALKALSVLDRYRMPAYEAPLELVEINLVPLFEAAFVPVGYRPLTDGLDPGHEAAYSDPVLLTPETAYLVSNLRLEQTSLLARSHEEVPSADVALKLAEITWRLANLTADRDDVNSAIAAQNLALRHWPDLAERAETRLVQLRALSGQ